MTSTLRRPRLLSRAAAAGAALYRRERDLIRVMPKLFGKGVAALLPALTEAEAACEAERRGGAATYSISRHVALLSALIAESASGAGPARA